MFEAIGDTTLDLIGFNSDAEKDFYVLLQDGYESMINSCTFLNKEINVGSCPNDIFIKNQTSNNFCKDNRNDNLPLFYIIILSWKCENYPLLELDSTNAF